MLLKLTSYMRFSKYKKATTTPKPFETNQNHSKTNPKPFHGLKTFFVDNTPAWSCMINGYSSSKPMAEMGNLLHLTIAALQIDCWVEWVNSDANIADLPFRLGPQHQRGQLYAARPVFKQQRMIFLTPNDSSAP